MARKNIWEQIWESTEGPTVTVTIPRDHAESLLKVLAASLEEEMPDDGMGDLDPLGDDDLDSVDDLDFGGGDEDLGDEPVPGADLDFGDHVDMAAGDDDDGDDEPAPPKKRGRPPGSTKKKGGDEKGPPEKDDDGDEDDEDKKDEAAGDYRPQTALGESSFVKAARVLTRTRGKR
jgi:hypothetical protein